MSLNIVMLSGRLTKDVELTTTNNGISRADFSIAVDRPYSNNGEKQTDFLNIITWRTLADNCYKYLKKGSKCNVVGSIQTRTYDAKDGTKRYVTEILANQVEFTDNKPVENKPKKEESYEQINTFEPISDSELPF